MFETYDTNRLAYVEHSGEYYDLNLKAWVPVPSAMTYDTTGQAWVERLYADYCVLSTKIMQSSDTLEITNSGFIFRTSSKSESRMILFKLPFKFKNGDLFECDIVTNALGRITIGKEFVRSGGSSTGGNIININGENNQHFTAKNDSGVPSDAVDYYIKIYSSVDKNAYSAISNLTINGKKYGFRE